jgi:hypothetical protein
LVANFGRARDITRNVQINKKYQRWPPEAGGHLGFFKSLKLLNSGHQTRGIIYILRSSRTTRSNENQAMSM